MKKKILLVYPKIPSTYWGFEYSLRFTGKKTTYPPLGLLTVAGLIPDTYDLKLVNLNTGPLKVSDILEADYIFLSAMIVQKESFDEVVSLAHKYNKTVVAGGPYPTESHLEIEGVDHFVLDEAEITLPLFLADLESGNARKLYRSESKPDISLAPIPRFDLMNINDYSSMALQSSRGCPFSCEFCDIIELFGRVPRVKSPDQFVAELEALKNIGYRGSVFIVDDNFIGNNRAVKNLLKAVIEWQARNKNPFTFITEASINLAHDDELMKMMVQAHFNMVFVGIETPSEDSLMQAGKSQNTKISLLDSVKKIQESGLEVSAGFILGFDNEKEDIFDRQIKFIKESAIPMAMIGLLAAIPETRLYRRLKLENRLLHESEGNNTHSFELNFIPTMPTDKLIEGYKKVISNAYKPREYFDRCLNQIRRLPNTFYSAVDRTPANIFMYSMAFLKSLILQTFSSYGFHYLKYLAGVVISKHNRFPEAIKYAIFGYHFFKITEKHINKKMAVLDNFRHYIERLRNTIQVRADCVHSLDLKNALKDLFELREKILPSVMKKYSRVFSLSSNYAEILINKVDFRIREYAESITEFIKNNIEKAGYTVKLKKFKGIELDKPEGKDLLHSHSIADLKAAIDKFIVEMSGILVKKAAEAKS